MCVSFIYNRPGANFFPILFLFVVGSVSLYLGKHVRGKLRKGETLKMRLPFRKKPLTIPGNLTKLTPSKLKRFAKFMRVYGFIMAGMLLVAGITVLAEFFLICRADAILWGVLLALPFLVSSAIYFTYAIRWWKKLEGVI